MSTKKTNKAKHHCRKHGHTMRFSKYVGIWNMSVHPRHIDRTPKRGIFKCCICKHTVESAIKINSLTPRFVGEEKNHQGMYYYDIQQVVN